MTGKRIRLGTPEPPARFSHFSGIIDHPRIEWLGQIDQPFDPERIGDLDAMISSDEWMPETRACMASCQLKGVLTFHILDGVTRWKNMFENPRSAEIGNGTPFMQPLMADVTFIMGELQAAILKWLGNERILISGLPRFARLERRNCRHGECAEPRILIASSNRPWYTDAQREQFLPAFHALLQSVEQQSHELGFALNHRLSWLVDWGDVDPAWLGPHPPLSEQLRDCAALITTPSTVAVEAMLLGIPTLIFDPWADPVVIPSPWLANDATIAAQLLPSLLAPSRQRARLQDGMRDLLACECDQAAETIVSTIETTIEERRQGDSITTPASRSATPSPTAAARLHEDWTLHNPQVLGLVQTIPQLISMLHQNTQTIQTLRSSIQTINDTILARSRPSITTRVKARLVRTLKRVLGRR